MQNIPDAVLSESAKLITKQNESILPHLLNFPPETSVKLLSKLSDETTKILFDHAKTQPELLKRLLHHIVSQSEWKEINKKFIPLLDKELLSFAKSALYAGHLLSQAFLDVFVPKSESKHEDEIITALRKQNEFKEVPPVSIKLSNGEEISLIEEKKEDVGKLLKHGTSAEVLIALNRYHRFHRITQAANWLQAIDCLSTGYSSGVTLDFVSDQLQKELKGYQESLSACNTDEEIKHYYQGIKSNTNFIIYDSTRDDINKIIDEHLKSKKPIIAFDRTWKTLSVCYPIKQLADKVFSEFQSASGLPYSSQIQLLNNASPVLISRILFRRRKDGHTIFELLLYFDHDILKNIPYNNFCISINDLKTKSQQEYEKLIQFLAYEKSWLDDKELFSKLLPIVYDDLHAAMKQSKKEAFLQDAIIKHRASILEYKVPAGIKGLSDISIFKEREDYDRIRSLCNYLYSKISEYKSQSKWNPEKKEQFEKIEKALENGLAKLKQDKSMSFSNFHFEVFLKIAEAKKWCDSRTTGFFIKTKKSDTFSDLIDEIYKNVKIMSPLPPARFARYALQERKNKK